MEIAITAGFAIVIFFFIYLGEKLLGKESFIMKLLGYNCFFASLMFVTILFFLLTQFASGQDYQGVIRSIFIVFQILFGIVSFPGFLVTGILSVLEGYRNLAGKSKKKVGGGIK